MKGKSSVIIIICLFISLFAILGAFPTRANVVTNDPASDMGAWLNGANAYTSNNLYATTVLDAATHTYSTYGITGDGTVDSVEIGAEQFILLGGLGDENKIRATWDGGVSWSSWQVLTANVVDPDSVEWKNITMATTWTWAKLNNVNFQVQIQSVAVSMNCQAGLCTYSLDYIPVRIYWTPNVAPTIDDKIVSETWYTHVPYSHQWNSSDPDLDAHTWTVYSNASFVSLEYDNRTAWLNGTCFDVSIGLNYSVWVNVSDGTASDSDFFVLYCVASSQHAGGYWMVIQTEWKRDGLSNFILSATVKTNAPNPNIQCTWSFDDGTQTRECNTTHSYPLALYQTYSIGLTVDNGYWVQEYSVVLVQNNYPVVILVGFTIILLSIALVQLSKKKWVWLECKS